ncbi:hypothetical protein GCM10023221_22110 [Luteimicrobium xylanilyticum]
MGGAAVGHGVGDGSADDHGDERLAELVLGQEHARAGDLAAVGPERGAEQLATGDSGTASGGASHRHHARVTSGLAGTS